MVPRASICKKTADQTKTHRSISKYMFHVMSLPISHFPSRLLVTYWSNKMQPNRQVQYFFRHYSAVGKVGSWFEGFCLVSWPGQIPARRGARTERANLLRRSPSKKIYWLRVPIRHKEEFVVGGYLPGPRQWRTLILGQYDREGKFV